MNALTSNILFNYEYRDAGNYHISGYEIFSNPESLPLSKVEEIIKTSLIDSEFFDPCNWKVKRLKHNDWIPDLDHTWNKFDSPALVGVLHQQKDDSLMWESLIIDLTSSDCVVHCQELLLAQLV
jgi:hypothetical protein